MSARSARVHASLECCVAVAVVVVAVVVATAVTASAAASGLMNGASSSANADLIMSSSESGMDDELDGEGGIESNSIVSSADGDHPARAVCCTCSAYCGAICQCGVRGEFGGADGEDENDIAK